MITLVDENILDPGAHLSVVSGDTDVLESCRDSNRNQMGSIY